MTPTTFLRLLKTPIDDKGNTLAAQIAALNAAASPLPAGEGPGVRADTFTLDPAAFAQIPSSPFAYWAPRHFLDLFQVPDEFETDERIARVGLSTSDDFRFLRAFWEINPEFVAFSRRETLDTPRWVSFGKGGVFSPYHSDLHMVLDWSGDGSRLKEFIRRKGDSPSRSIRSESYYFSAGLTWPLRASHFAPYALPEGSIFGVRGYAILAPRKELPVLLGILNSSPFDYLFKLNLGRAGYPEFVVGVLQRLPWIAPSDYQATTVSQLANEAHALQRDRDRTNEITHAFCLPSLAVHRDAATLLEAGLLLDVAEQERLVRLAAIQAEIDDIVFDLYGLDAADRALIEAEMGMEGHGDTEDTEADQEISVADDEDDPEPPKDLPLRVQNLLMWCVGVAFGRWDARMALDPTLLPALQGPFDPLPRCSPGALVASDGLPPANADAIAPEAWLRSRQNVLDLPTVNNSQFTNSPINHSPIPIAWDGFLVDDPTHPSDIITRVRQVLRLLWGDRADAIEQEACDILGFASLRSYFRDPRKGFFAFHLKRYSKSRRKAPIYWLLQSEKRNYAIWLTIHRQEKHSLYVAGRDYADAKIALEQGRLAELREGLDALEGSARRRRERAVERQQKLVDEVTAFRNELDRVALLDIPPDLNDGVLIGIAPLHRLVPWKEAEKMWHKLLAGDYAWSAMSRQIKANKQLTPE